ncbi:acyl-CoA synthetase [Desulfofundulus sp. TPOSR]|uniref:acyl-CoA synthetase n=1 Tax=Desulfofundulus sp. TPOSR TaxID=2714340 RepID=UPI0037BF4298
MTYAAVDRYAVDPKKVALFHVRKDFSVEKITFRELKELSNKFANVLTGFGLQRGDRVARLLPRIPETYISFFGTWKAGMVDVPLYTAFGPDAIEYRLRDSGAKVLITDVENRRKIEPIKDTFKDNLKIIVVANEQEQGLQPGDLSFWHEMNNASGDFVAADTKLHDPAVFVYTSGTTGPPKGTVILQKGIISVMPYAEYCLNVLEDDMYWGFADPGWTYGLFSAGSAVMALGRSLVVYEPRFEPEGWYKTVKKLGVTNFTAAPTAFRAIMAAGDDLARAYGLKFRYLASAGEPLNPEVVYWFEKHFGVPVRDMYGITEVSMLICNSPYLPLRIGSCGKPVPGFEVSIRDEQGRECAAREIGLICAKHNGFFLSDGYFGKGEKWQKAFIQGEWFNTGDLAYKDEDGYFYFVGRHDDVISSAGYRIGPFEVESCIMEHPAVAECAVIGKPDALRGEIVKAFVVLCSGYRASDELATEIINFVRTKLSKHNYPREIEFVGELPKTSTGKIQRRILRDLELERMNKKDLQR